MALARKLFVNWHTRRRQATDLTESRDPVLKLGFLKYEKIPFEVAIIEPDITRPTKFTRIDITGLSLTMAINDTLDDGTPLAVTSGGSWIQDTGRSVYVGSLDLNVSEMNTYIGTSTGKDAYFELVLTDASGNLVKVLQEVCTVQAGVTTVTTTSPDPSDVYITLSQTLGLFVPRAMANGESISIPSPNGQYRRIIGCNDDGSARDDIETL